MLLECCWILRIHPVPRSNRATQHYMETWNVQIRKWSNGFLGGLWGGVHFPIENSTIVETGKSGNPNMMRPRSTQGGCGDIHLANCWVSKPAAYQQGGPRKSDDSNHWWPYYHRSHKDWSIRGLLRLWIAICHVCSMVSLPIIVYHEFLLFLWLFFMAHEFSLFVMSI